MTDPANRLLLDLRALTPDIAARAAEIEAGRRVPPALVAARSMSPRRCNGGCVTYTPRRNTPLRRNDITQAPASCCWAQSLVRKPETHMNARTSPLQATIVKPKQVLPIKPFGLDIKVLLTTEATGGALSVVMAYHKPGEGPPDHVHFSQEEILDFIRNNDLGPKIPGNLSQKPYFG